MAKLLVVLAALVAVGLAANVKRQIGNPYNCGPTDGPVADVTDCGYFYQCDNGVATRMPCQSGLEFNPVKGWCDWPSEMPNPQCNRVSTGSIRNGPCQGRQGSVLIQHPNFCNAFMYCGSGFLYDGCSFCASGSYFDEASQRCVTAVIGDEHLNCKGKDMIREVNMEYRRLDPSCYPSNPNIFSALIAKIQAQGVFRPLN